MKNKSCVKNQSQWYKYTFLVFSLAVIAYGIKWIFASTAYFNHWSEKMSVYISVPLAIIGTLYYLHFFFPKYENRLWTAKHFLVFLVLCSGLSLAAYLITTFDTWLDWGLPFTELHERWGAGFGIILPALGLVGLFIPRKIGWVLSLVYPCYMFCKFFAGVSWSYYYYHGLVYCIIFPVFCLLPVMRNYFRIRSAKELCFCIGAAAIITTPFVLFTRYMYF